MPSHKKYLINIDFPEKSRVHLNPFYYNDMWCQLDKDKKIEDGGKIEVTREEAIEYLSGKKPLIFNNRKVTNLIRCKNCSSRLHWDIPTE